MKSKLLVENTIYKALSNDARKRNLTPDELCEILLKLSLHRIYCRPKQQDRVFTKCSGGK